jgi:hypothetical protein
MRKYTCESCGQEFTRFWNLKRHLLTIHPVEYSHWNIKLDQPQTGNIGARLANPHQNNLYKHPTDVDLLDKAADDYLDLEWKTSVYREIQSIKNIVQSIKYDVQTIIKILVKHS